MSAARDEAREAAQELGRFRRVLTDEHTEIDPLVRDDLASRVDVASNDLAVELGMKLDAPCPLVEAHGAARIERRSSEHARTLGQALGAVRVTHVDAQPPRRVPEKRIALHDVELDGADLAASRILDDAAAERLCEQLMTEANPEHGRSRADESAQGVLRIEDPGIARRNARGRSGDDERSELTFARTLAPFGVENGHGAVPSVPERFADHALERPAGAAHVRDRLTGHQDAERKGHAQ
jgi:hypothetical protein